jgi:leukotriene-A4 hydrolase
MTDIQVDTASQANFKDIATKHVSFDWTVDFNAKVLSGSATHTLKVKKDGVSEAMCVCLQDRKAITVISES